MRWWMLPIIIVLFTVSTCSSWEMNGYPKMPDIKIPNVTIIVEK